MAGGGPSRSCYPLINDLVAAGFLPAVGTGSHRRRRAQGQFRLASPRWLAMAADGQSRCSRHRRKLQPRCTRGPLLPALCEPRRRRCRNSGASLRTPRSHPPPSCCQACARFQNRVNRPSKASSTVPMGPWRCLPMMTSALPWTLFHHRLPGGHLVEFVVAGLFAFAVVFLAEDEHHHVGVLLDRAGFAEVGRAAGACPRGFRPGARAGRAR